MHQRPLNSVGEARVGAGFLGARDRMGGDEMHAGGQMRRTLATTACLTEPTSDTMAPGFSAGAMPAATAPHAPTGTQKMTRSAPRTASAADRRGRRRARPSAVNALQRPAMRSHATMVRARFLRRATRASDEPIRPSPTMTSRSKSGSGSAVADPSAMASQEIAQRVDDEAIGFFRADRQAQRLGKP